MFPKFPRALKCQFTTSCSKAKIWTACSRSFVLKVQVKKLPAKTRLWPQTELRYLIPFRSYAGSKMGKISRRTLYITDCRVHFAIIFDFRRNHRNLSVSFTPTNTLNYHYSYFNKLATFRGLRGANDQSKTVELPSAVDHHI